jgi:Ca2+-binding RTX toxin-like protein
MATIFGVNGPDSLSGTTSGDLIYGGAGSDSVSGGDGNDTIIGISGDDTIAGDTGNDFIQGDGQGIVNPGFDAGVPAGTYEAESPNTGWQSTSGTIEVWGSGFDGITSPDGSNFLELDQEGNVDSVWQDVQTTAGQTFTITIQARNRPGGIENDQFEIRWGGVLIDTVQPGPSWVDYTYTVTGDGSLTRLQLSELASQNNFAGIFINSVTLVSDSTAEGGNDQLYGGAGADTIDAGGGNDLVYGGAAGTESALIYGGDGNDTLYGEFTGGSGDIVYGGAGADVIDGGSGGADTLFGGEGNDQLRGGVGADALYAGTGEDTVFLAGSFGNDLIYAGDNATETDRLDATALSAALTVTIAGDGVGTIGDGSSTANFQEFEEFLLGSANDTVNGAGNTRSIEVQGGAGNDLITSGSGADTLGGGIGADTIYGGLGNDNVDGGQDADILYGGGGDDTLTGGTGGDRFISTGAGNDVITDFDAVTNVKDGNTANNDFVDLAPFYNATTLATWNAENPTNTFTTPIGLLRFDLASDGILNETAAGWSAGNSLTLTGVAASDLNDENTGVICFAAGTLVKTIAGDVAVDDLQVGFRVLTMDAGYQMIRWIGSRHLSAAELAAQPNLRPIRIAAGALGRNAPETDLIVSPQHRILVRSNVAERMFGMREVLVPAKLLLDFPGVDVIDDAGGVTYWHFLFDAHQVVFANGMPAESLFTGPEALKSVGEGARREILAIFPQLADLDVNALPGAARHLAKGKKARQMVWRMVKNDHDALAPQPSV